MTSRSVAGPRSPIRAVVALLLLATPAAAQPAPTPATANDPAAFRKELDSIFVANGLTSDQAAVRAVKISPTVRAKAASVQSSQAQAKVAELAQVPQIGASAGYTRLSFLEPIVFGTFEIPQLQNSYTTEGSINVPVSDYVLRFPKLIDAAKLGVDVAKLTKRDSEVSAAQEARVAYYEWIRAKLQLLVAQHQLAQIRATLGQVRALAEAQRVSRADLMRVESQEASGELSVDQLTWLARLREEQLRIEIGATDNEPLAIGEDIRRDVAIPASGGLDEMVTVAERQRYDFRAYDVGITAREKQREADRAGYFPRLSAFAVGDYARPNARVFPQADKFDWTWQAGVLLTWTLNDPLITNANDQRYAAEIRELRANRENLQRGARIEVLAAQQAVALAQGALATTAKGLASAEESYRVRQALLEAQRATAVELVDAQATLTAAQIAALNARIDLRIAIVNLAHATGADTK